VSLSLIDAPKVMKGLKAMHSTNPTKVTVRTFMKAMKAGTLDADGKFRTPIYQSSATTKPVFQSHTNNIQPTNGVSVPIPEVSRFAALRKQPK
jgi:hypothetical protein